MTVPPHRLEEIRAALPAHIRLTRAEPGCLRFDVVESDDIPGRFDVSEDFTDRAALSAHQARVKAAHWGRITRGMPRFYTVTGPEK